MAPPKGSKSKTQASITSFFGAGATSTPPMVKRKAKEPEKSVEEDQEPESEHKEASPRKKQRTERKLKVAVKSKSTAKTVKEKKDKSPEPRDDEEVENDKMDVEQEDEDVMVEETVSRKSRAKPGRRRLRQLIVEDEDEDDDTKDSDDELLNKRKGAKAKRGGAYNVVEIDDDDDDDNEQTNDGNANEDKNDKEVDNEQKMIKQESNKASESTKVEEEDVEMKGDEKEKADAEESDKDADEAYEEEEEADDLEEEEKPSSGFFSPRSSKAKASTKSTANKTKANTDTTVAPLDADAGTIPYTALANVFNKIEASSGRLVIQDLLCNFFRQVITTAPQDLLACIYLCVCTDLAPPFENLKIGIGDAILIKAISEATGSTMKFIKEMYHKEGDLGKVAQNARSKQHTLSFAPLQAPTIKPKVLSVPDVYNQFVKIAKMTGNNSQQQKTSIIKGLLVKCEKDKKASADKSEQASEAAKFIIRGLQGKLRIGLAEKSILLSLTYAFMLSKDAKDKEKQEKAVACVKRAFAECPSYNALVKAFEDVQATVKTKPFLSVEDFEEVAARCVLTPGTPVSPMLARPTKAYALVFDRFQGMPFTCEYKYDGERAQIHIQPDGTISIFSRNFENSTERFPDVRLAISQAAGKEVKSCIVDSEVVAVDKATNKRLPFQVLSTRSRKNVKVEDIKVQVCIYAFDLIFFNGESLLRKPLSTRRALLHENFHPKDGCFEFASSMDVDGVVPGTDDAEALEIAVTTVRTFLEKAVQENCEGLMVKTLEKEATYEPANRSHKWLKLKKDYLGGIGDSTDLVPIGAFYGRGKRTGVYGAYLLACYDPDTEMFQPVTKLGTGLSDEQLKEFYEQLREKVVDRVPREYAIGDGIKPDVWFEPSCVWEILGADLSISPKYTAAIGLVSKDKGISLRFPRFIRIRDDKGPTSATNSAQIADFYRAQGLTTVGGEAEDDDDEMLI